MATVQSTQLARRLGQGYSLSSGLNEVDNHITAAYFDRNTTDAVNGNLAENDVIQLAIIPKGARLLGGRITHTALGTSVTIEVGLAPYNPASGTSADPDALLTATSAASAGGADFGKTIALKYGDVLDEPMYLTATVAGATPAASQSIRGFVEYLLK